MINVICLLLYVSVLSFGNLLFKQVATALHGGGSFGGMLLLILQQPLFYVAVGLYGCATFIWIWILSRVTLSMAYPFMALPIIIVPILAIFLFGETQSPRYWLGAALVGAGIVISQS